MLPENALIGMMREFFENRRGRVFLVGGSVRDCLLNNERNDYDFMCEEDPTDFAEQLAARLVCRPFVNKKLLTASLQTKWGTIDLACARKELYDTPGALPRVFPAKWQEDLKRRDISINALAVPLKKDGWGDIIDIVEGRQDLADGVIRTLHGNSFRDDPTRILRVLRFKNRLGFFLDEATATWMRRDWSYLERVSPARRMKEWLSICREKEITKILWDIYREGGWPSFFKSVQFEPEAITACEELLKGCLPGYLQVWKLVLLEILDGRTESLLVLADFWGLAKKDFRALYDALRIADKYREDVTKSSQRGFLQVISGLSLEGLYYIYRHYGEEGLTWEEFRHKAKSYRMPVDGDSLMKIGVETGPRMGKLIRRLEECYEREMFHTQEEGMALAKLFLEEENNV